MHGSYAFFDAVRSIFNLWQISIISMADFHREHRRAAHAWRFAASRCGDSCVCVAAMRYHPCSRENRMTLRAAKVAMVFAVALYYTLLVFNNIADYNSNYEFVRHVMMMDSTFPGNHGMWRALDNPSMHTAFYLWIIGWEAVTMLLSWWGGFRMLRALRGPVAEFHRSKRMALAALALGLLKWLIAFLAIGG